ncbi:MAG: alpha/beta fold hydrolase [Salinigranum sp.]
MPTATHGDVSLYYDTGGSGEAVVFVGDVGYGAWQWGWQYPAVAGPFRAVVTDLRGAGRSDVPPGPYSVAALADDVAAVLREAGERRAHVVGAGLGGMVALHLALSTGRVASLTLLAGAAAGDDLDLEPLFGAPDDPAALRESLAAALSADFRAAHPEAVERIVAWRGDEDASRDAWEAQVAAVRAFDARDRLHEVTIPALVVHGRDDAAWPVGGGRKLAEGLPRGEFLPVDGAGHLVGVEASGYVDDELLGFLESSSASE